MLEPPTVDDIAEEKRRLGGQCKDMVELFRANAPSPTSNIELSEISLKYTSRISDLRTKHGFVIEIVERDYASGVTWYQLRETQPGLLF